MGLCEALHGRRTWLELELPWEPMGSLPEMKGKGEGGGGEEGAASWVGGGGHHAGSYIGEGSQPFSPCAWLSAAACCVQEEGRRRE
jgi:hypothetical protein